MGIRIIWSPEAAEDLEHIKNYIARDSEYYAKSVVKKILVASKSISNFPYSGRIVPEIGDPNLRERIIYSYRMIYKIRKESILITAIIHGKQLIDDLSWAVEYRS